MKKWLFFIVLPGLLMACEVSPKPIAYGNDGCYYCNMTIVDRQHASQIVTQKGRAYTFDAIECMLNYTEENPGQKIAMYLVADFNEPGTLVDATTATYLISEEIPSPMGAYLSGFDTETEAQELQTRFEGEVYSWEALQKKFAKKQ